MTREEKDLVLQDLCARLPYGVYVQIVDRVGLTHTLVELNPEVIQKMWSYKSIKPYLRPMSSMTEEERKSLPFPWNFDGINITSYTKENGFIEIQQTDIIELTDWLNKKMFDWRGLIPKDLALSTDEFNPYED
jgi:hypothetical protein